MRNALGLLIIVALMGYGVVRIGVAALLLAQAAALLDVPDLADAVAEVVEFLGAREDRALVAMSVPAYFVWIMTMGALLVGGGTGALLRRWWGLGLLAAYLLMHAALFVNYREVNPKLLGLAASVIVVVGLAWLRPPRPLTAAPG